MEKAVFLRKELKLEENDYRQRRNAFDKFRVEIQVQLPMQVWTCSSWPELSKDLSHDSNEVYFKLMPFHERVMGI
jgi:hypothetical protein